MLLEKHMCSSNHSLCKIQVWFYILLQTLTNNFANAIFSFKLFIFLLFGVCMHRDYTNVTKHICRLVVSSLEYVLFLHHMGSEYQTHVVRVSCYQFWHAAVMLTLRSVIYQITTKYFFFLLLTGCLINSLIVSLSHIFSKSMKSSLWCIDWGKVLWV